MMIASNGSEFTTVDRSQGCALSHHQGGFWHGYHKYSCRGMAPNGEWATCDRGGISVFGAVYANRLYARADDTDRWSFQPIKPRSTRILFRVLP